MPTVFPETRPSSRLWDACVRGPRAERQQNEVLRERSAKVASEVTRTRGRLREGTKALDELRAATRRDVSKLAERSEQIESALENAQKERSRLAQETAELRIALDTERSEASARYGDLERRRRREVEAARAELPEGYRDASVEADLRKQLDELKMARNPETERLEAALVVAKSDLAEARAELSREEEARRGSVVARQANSN